MVSVVRTRSFDDKTVKRISALFATGMLVLAACGDDDGAPETQRDPEDDVETTTAGCGGDHDAEAPLSSPSPEQLEDLELSLTEIGQFDEPTALTSRPGDTDLFVAEKSGRVIRLAVEGEGTDRTYAPEDSPLIDLSDEVVSDGYEQGLLDLEFSPDGEQLYLSYTAHGETDGGDSRVTAYDYDDGGSLDDASRKEVLVEEQPAAEHNGGAIFFGPDGCLYLGLGDGVPVADALGNAQDTGTLLGAVLRIDPEATVESDEPYAVPEDNPFVADDTGSQQDDGPRPEIWLYGVRNPWRSSFDAETGDLWVADVGEHDWEEINFLPADEGAGRGANLGWSEMEGTHPFEGGSNPPEAVLPIFDYPNPDDGNSVTGGVVYRGDAIEDLEGAYLFGDWVEPTLRALTVDGDETTETWFDDVEVPGLASFGVDTHGEVYLVSQQGPIYRLDP